MNTGEYLYLTEIFPFFIELELNIFTEKSFQCSIIRRVVSF